MYKDFADNMVVRVASLAQDLASYRAMCHPENGVKKMPLFIGKLLERPIPSSASVTELSDKSS